MTKKKINAIIKRGYTLNEEYEELHNEKGNLIRVWSEEKDERFWGIKLGDNENLFILANDPISFWGCPRSVVGMVAWKDGDVMNHEKSIELFKKAGQEAIDYFHKKQTENPAKSE